METGDVQKVVSRPYQFKSYYVVWKRGGFKEKNNQKISLNRTM